MGQTFITVNIRVKPYIKHFLIHNYGNPVVLEPGTFISKYLAALLSRPIKADNHKCITYTEEVCISINENKFKRYGFGLTKTAAKDFNVAIENHIRNLIRNITDNILFTAEINENWQSRYHQLKREHNALIKLHTLDVNANTIKELRKFEALLNKRLADSEKHRVKVTDALQSAAYVCLGFDETILPLETIRKDYYRYKLKQKH